MKCGSQNCERAAYARWYTVVLGTSTLTPTLATFLLCRDHDDFYTEREHQHRAFRIGRLEDEVCHHTPHQWSLRGGV